MLTAIERDIDRIEGEIDRLTKKLCNLKQFVKDFPNASQLEMNYFSAWLEHSDLSYDEIIENMREDKKDDSNSR